MYSVKQISIKFENYWEDLLTTELNYPFSVKQNKPKKNNT